MLRIAKRADFPAEMVRQGAELKPRPCILWSAAAGVPLCAGFAQKGVEAPLAATEESSQANHISNDSSAAPGCGGRSQGARIGLFSDYAGLSGSFMLV